jgi:hypothetical protein
MTSRGTSTTPPAASSPPTQPPTCTPTTSTNSVFLDSINPGNTVHALVAFDRLEGDKAVRAELHDSVLSSGVTVKLP